MIDGKNVDQYKGLLTATTAELAKRFPSFHVNVYPTHRTVSLPKAVLDNGMKKTPPAPNPSRAGWLSITYCPVCRSRFRSRATRRCGTSCCVFQGVNINSKYDSWNVDSAGIASLAITGQASISYPIYENLTQPISSADVYYQMKLSYTGPARRAGEAIMLKDAANPLQQPRRAWQYLPGQRRVKLAPNLAYDTPNPGTAGAGTYDDVFRVQRCAGPLRLEAGGQAGNDRAVQHLQADLRSGPQIADHGQSPGTGLCALGKKHRVWVVEGNLKSGARHIYQKRRFYLDEDSWTALASDQYDARGQLYRGSFAFLSQSYDKQIPDSTPFMIYDLVGGSYNINGVVGPYGGIKYIDPLSKAQWSPESLAGAGIR